MKNEPLTIEELKEMAGQPVWCPDEEAYGVIMCDSIGKWAGIPFMHGVWYHDGIGVEFNHNIIERKLKCYRVISEKAETNMPTAYDVDAVVEQIKKEFLMQNPGKGFLLVNVWNNALNRAIEIVKGGSVDDRMNEIIKKESED